MIPKSFSVTFLIQHAMGWRLLSFDNEGKLSLILSLLGKVNIRNVTPEMLKGVFIKFALWMVFTKNKEKI